MAKLSYNNQAIYYDFFRITAPKIDLSPLFKDFGTIYKEQEPTLDITIKNTGDEPLTISKISSEDLPKNSSIILPTNLLIDINASTTSKIKIATVQLGPFRSNINFESDDPTAPVKKVEISGTIKELIKLAIEALDKHIEVDKPVEFAISGDGKSITDVNVVADSRTFNTGNTNKVSMTFGLPGKYTLIASKQNTTTTDYQDGILIIEVFKKLITEQLSIIISKYEYYVGEAVDIQLLADGNPAQGFIKYDNQIKQTDSNGKISLVFNEPKNITITAYKDKTETDKTITAYNETSVNIQIVQPPSPVEGISVAINNFIKSILDFFAKLFGG